MCGRSLVELGRECACWSWDWVRWWTLEGLPRITLHPRQGPNRRDRGQAGGLGFQAGPVTGCLTDHVVKPASQHTSLQRAPADPHAAVAHSAFVSQQTTQATAHIRFTSHPLSLLAGIALLGVELGRT